jgi:hypothetical protein
VGAGRIASQHLTVARVVVGLGVASNTGNDAVLAEDPLPPSQAGRRFDQRPGRCRGLCRDRFWRQAGVLLPTVTSFMDAHQLADVTVVAGAGMALESNQEAIEDAGLVLIIGARVPKEPYHARGGAETTPARASQTARPPRSGPRRGEACGRAAGRSHRLSLDQDHPEAICQEAAATDPALLVSPLDAAAGADEVTDPVGLIGEQSPASAPMSDRSPSGRGPRRSRSSTNSRSWSKGPQDVANRAIEHLLEPMGRSSKGNGACRGRFTEVASVSHHGRGRRCTDRAVKRCPS